jgi:hypothetical protein
MSKNDQHKKYYNPVPKKDYHIWIEQHYQEIIDQPSSNRLEYVLQNMSRDLNQEFKKNFVYQLLYRQELLQVKQTQPELYEVKLKELIAVLKENNSNLEVQTCIKKLTKLIHE